ncbi:MAG: hypothetical protein J6W13_08120 [Salinivirgaceae bacterium]|nr:hypothetical protein [Salinivirgaceae bacterium]
MKTNLLLIAGALMAAGCGSIQQRPFVYESENTGAALPKIKYVNPDQLPQCTTLPDPFAWSDGSGRSTNFADWERRRNEIKSEIEFYEIGAKPDKPEDITATLNDTILTVTIKHNGQTLTLTSRLRIPKTSDGPFPVSIGMGRFSGTGSLRRDIFDGCIQVPFDHDQVIRSSHQAVRDDSAQYYKLYPDARANGNYSAWAWGVSRLIDGLEMVADQINADLSHICVTGCSYAGKMAMYSSALDERVALAIVQESGGGGINSWRVSDDFTARTDTNVERINNTNYTWFSPALKDNFDGRVDRLPFDHHEILAMCAPRAVLVLGNGDYEWLCDHSGYVSCRAAEAVYQTFGIADRFGFVFDDKHPHCRASDLQSEAVKAFVEKFLFDDASSNTMIREITPTLKNVDYQKWIEPWAGKE